MFSPGSFVSVSRVCGTGEDKSLNKSPKSDNRYQSALLSFWIRQDQTVESARDAEDSKKNLGGKLD
jgi:hypothetical protein